MARNFKTVDTGTDFRMVVSPYDTKERNNGIYIDKDDRIIVHIKLDGVPGTNVDKFVYLENNGSTKPVSSSIQNELKEVERDKEYKGLEAKIGTTTGGESTVRVFNPARMEMFGLDSEQTKAYIEKYASNDQQSSGGEAAKNNIEETRKVGVFDTITNIQEINRASVFPYMSLIKSLEGENKTYNTAKAATDAGVSKEISSNSISAGIIKAINGFANVNAISFVADYVIRDIAREYAVITKEDNANEDKKTELKQEYTTLKNLIENNNGPIDEALKSYPELKAAVEERAEKLADKIEGLEYANGAFYTTDDEGKSIIFYNVHEAVQDVDNVNLRDELTEKMASSNTSPLNNKESQVINEEKEKITKEKIDTAPVGDVDKTKLNAQKVFGEELRVTTIPEIGNTRGENEHLLNNAINELDQPEDTDQNGVDTEEKRQDNPVEDNSTQDPTKDDNGKSDKGSDNRGYEEKVDLRDNKKNDDHIDKDDKKEKVEWKGVAKGLGIAGAIMIPIFAPVGGALILAGLIKHLHDKKEEKLEKEEKNIDKSKEEIKVGKREESRTEKQPEPVVISGKLQAEISAVNIDKQTGHESTIGGKLDQIKVVVDSWKEGLTGDDVNKAIGKDTVNSSNEKLSLGDVIKAATGILFGKIQNGETPTNETLEKGEEEPVTKTEQTPNNNDIEEQEKDKHRSVYAAADAETEDKYKEIENELKDQTDEKEASGIVDKIIDELNKGELTDSASALSALKEELDSKDFSEGVKDAAIQEFCDKDPLSTYIKEENTETYRVEEQDNDIEVVADSVNKAIEEVAEVNPNNSQEVDFADIMTVEALSNTLNEISYDNDFTVDREESNVDNGADNQNATNDENKDKYEKNEDSTPFFENISKESTGLDDYGKGDEEFKNPYNDNTQNTLEGLDNNKTQDDNKNDQQQEQPDAGATAEDAQEAQKESREQKLNVDKPNEESTTDTEEKQFEVKSEDLPDKYWDGLAKDYEEE